MVAALSMSESKFVVNTHVVFRAPRSDPSTLWPSDGLPLLT